MTSARSLTYLRSFYWRKSLIYGFRLILTQKFPVSPLIFAWLKPYVVDFNPWMQNNRIIFNVIGDFMFVSSLYILGGNFWDKLRALFQYNAKVQFTEQEAIASYVKEKRGDLPPQRVPFVLVTSKALLSESDNRQRLISQLRPTSKFPAVLPVIFPIARISMR
jgi:hypothetical protein